MLNWIRFNDIMYADSVLGWYWVILKDGSKLMIDSLDELGVKNESKIEEVSGERSNDSDSY